MLKNLSEECLLNISSFLLGTPQQLKFKNSKALKQIQKLYKLDIFDFSEDEYIRTVEYGEYDEIVERQRELTYGYGARNKNYNIDEIVKIIKRQCGKLKSMVKPDGDTHLNITFNYYLNGEEAELLFTFEDIDYSTKEELLEYITMRTNSIQRMVNGYVANGYEVKIKSVWFLLKNITPYIEN